MGLIYLLSVLSVLLSVAFFTLLEVRLLGLIHIRLGPNKVGVAGYLQPFGDIVKLFSKGFWSPASSDSFYYFFSPLLGLLMGLMVWLLFVGGYVFLSVFWGPVFFFCLSSLVVYYLLLSGWSSGSAYSSLGSFRSAAQAIAYEVAMIFIMFSILFVFSNFNLVDLFFAFGGAWYFVLSLPLFLIWMISCLAESSRSPFDFSEGESELVSGFNTEYFGGFFSFIFIAEYSLMLFLGILTVLFFGGAGAIWLKVLLVVYFYIMVRGAYPRLRFDGLMMLMWKCILPMVIGGFVFFLSISFLS